VVSPLMTKGVSRGLEEAVLEKRGERAGMGKTRRPAFLYREGEKGGSWLVMRESWPGRNAKGGISRK